MGLKNRILAVGLLRTPLRLRPGGIGVPLLRLRASLTRFLTVFRVRPFWLEFGLERGLGLDRQLVVILVAK